jgi:hypothetical protein
MPNPFEILVTNLTSLGFFNFFLPFIFTFAVVYGLLLKLGMLGEDPKVIGVVSMAVAFFTIGFGGPLLGEFFINLVGFATIVLAGILVIVLFVGFAGGDVSSLMQGKGITAIMAGLAIIVIYSIFQSVSGSTLGNDIISIFLVMIILGGAIVYITGK